MNFNRHHTQFPRTLHESNPDLKAIREDRRLIVPMLIPEHNQLHKEVPLVPAISHHMARRALRSFENYWNEYEPIENLENYQRSLEEAIKHEKCKPLERDLGELAIHAIDLQKPWIREGFIKL